MNYKDMIFALILSRRVRFAVSVAFLVALLLRELSVPGISEVASYLRPSKRGTRSLSSRREPGWPFVEDGLVYQGGQLLDIETLTSLQGKAN